jgi:hypothetical protein
MVIDGDPGVVDRDAGGTDAEKGRDIVGIHGDTADAARGRVEIKEAMETDGALVKITVGEVEGGIGKSDLEGKDLNGLAIEDVRFFAEEIGMSGGVEEDVEHGAEFTDGPGELEVIRGAVLGSPLRERVLRLSW